MDQDNFEIYKATMRKMARISCLHRMAFEKNISQMGIHQSQHHLLMYIAKEGQINSQKEIAERFGISPAAIARSLKSLEAEGFVERTSVEDDSRFNKIIITEKGNNIVSESHRMFKEMDESIFVDFSEKEIVQFNEYLDKMQSKLIEKNKGNCFERKSNEKE